MNNKPTFITLAEAQKIVDAYNVSTLKAQKQITEHYKSARRYYADSLRDLMLAVSADDQKELSKYVERHLLSWPVAGE